MATVTEWIAFTLRLPREVCEHLDRVRGYETRNAYVRHVLTNHLAAKDRREKKEART